MALRAGAKGVYLDETPLKSVTGENNYDPNNITYEFNLGRGSKRGCRTLRKNKRHETRPR